MAILKSEKVEYEAKRIIKDKEGHYIMIKVSIHEERIAILNVHVPNNRTSKYMQTQHCKNINSPKLIYRLNRIETKILERFSLHTQTS